ncbi:type II toxin-antitoxin system VapC family toxin [Vulcanococcus sp. Clear-D1]|jgi:PIN domain nuclease of toxin-antitoxin system|uniref:type II toxin-antitoxin system VapC family toxin n=1 Tax=Vulcanococcus sp. Clear-D1 TaxID=2766970 RepID=UPI0019AEBBBA|nr:type II toxin-antitoxin system VapC family toxin [Vulcanococcus sp. Clear-D1]MBD1194652.1 type II toxin-antitoxin system VapC family toxin [Vulcanococcus sp. Clear-D1]
MSTNGDGYLLDSHVLLWWWFDPDRLSEAARLPLRDPTTTIRVSAATVWELSLKHHQGKLPELDNVIQDLPSLLQADGFQPFPISIAHGLRAGGYSQLHRDPFDRMLAAQAELEGLVLITADAQLANFPCPILW